MFYKSAIIIILVYNITERYTFDQIVDYWYNEVKTRCIKNPIIAIVGNKSDLYSKEQVKEKEGKNFAQSIGALFKLTSCLNNSNVKELFEELGGVYLGLYSIKKLNGEEDDVSDEQRKEDERKRREQLLIESGGVVLNLEPKKEDKKGCC